jgi:hypothetical protein
METITLTKGHYTQPDATDSYVVDDAVKFRVPNGWQHIHNNTHYRLSQGQAEKVRKLVSQGYQLPCNTTLWATADPAAGQCPHCVDGSFIAGCGD